MKIFRQIFALLLAFSLSLVILSDNLFAAAYSFNPIQCENGLVKTTGSGNSTVVYDGLFDPNIVTDVKCDTLDSKRIFSGIACSYVLTLNKIFGSFYCALNKGMEDAMMAAVTVYIAIFGIKILMGTQEPTLGGGMIALLKLGAFVMFAMSGTTFITLIYNFFVGMMLDTVGWVMTSLTVNLTSLLDFSLSGSFDNMWTTLKDTVAAVLTGTPTSDLFKSIDSRIYNVIAGVDTGTCMPAGGTCSNANVCSIGGKVCSGVLEAGMFNDNGKLLVFFFILYTISAPIFFLALSLIATTFSLFFSTLVSFLMCITAVAFLICLAPIFLTFMLFNSTYYIFDSWVRFLISYSLQPMIVFAVFALWCMVIGSFVNFTKDLSKIMTFADLSHDAISEATSHEKGLVFCQPKYSNNPVSIKSVILPNSGATAPYHSNTSILEVVPGGPTIGCCQMDVSSSVDAFNGYVCNDTVPAVDISTVPAAALILPKELIKDSRFVYYIAYHLISLLIIGYAFYNLMKTAPQIAQALTQSKSMLPLGAGVGGGIGGAISKTTDAVRMTGGKVMDAVIKPNKTGKEIGNSSREFANNSGKMSVGSGRSGNNPVGENISETPLRKPIFNIYKPYEKHVAELISKATGKGSKNFTEQSREMLNRSKE